VLVVDPDPEEEPPLDPPDDVDEPLLFPDDPDEDADDVDELEELLVSSFPPHAAIAVALAKRSAARVATRPCGASDGVNAGRVASQNGQRVS
jgi:hypothetical protein